MSRFVPDFRRLAERYADACAARPYLIFAVSWTVCVLLAVIAVASGQMATTSNDGSEWLVKNDEYTREWRASLQLGYMARAAWEEASVDAGAATADSQQGLSGYPVEIFYHDTSSSNGNLFTPDILEGMRKIENIVMGGAEYDRYCLRTYTASGSHCTPPDSLLKFFFGAPQNNSDGSYQYQQAPLSQAAIDATLLDIWANNMTRVGRSFGKAFNNETLQSYWTRTTFHFGFPLEGFTSAEYEQEEQQAILFSNYLDKVDLEVQKWLDQKAPFMKTLLTDTGVMPDVDTRVEVIYMHKALSDKEFTDVVNSDLTWAVLSFTSVFAYMVYHTGSFWVAGIGMGISTMSYPIALLLYRCVFRVAYYEALNTLVLFIMLGIGADDVFVYFDALRQAEMSPEHCTSTASRLRFTVLRGAKATLVTSLTTAVSFLATSVSRMMPIAAFGIFACICVSVLYLVNTLTLPAALVIWDRNWSLLPFCVCSQRCCCVDSDKLAKQRVVRSQQSFKRSQSGKMTLAQSMSKAQKGDVVKYTRCETFLGQTYFHFLKKIRYGVVVVFLVMMCVGVSLAIRIRPPEDVELLFPDSHVLAKYTKAADPSKGPFQTSSTTPSEAVTVVLGAQRPYVDYAGTNRWKPDDLGKVVFADNMAAHELLTSPERRAWLMTFCDEMKKVPCTEKGCDPNLAKNLPLLARSSNCWTDQLAGWTRNVSLAMGTVHVPFQNLPEAAAGSTLVAFLTSPAGKMYQQDVLLSQTIENGVNVTRLQAARLHFSSTFVAPKSQVMTTKVVQAWDRAVSDLVAKLPGLEAATGLKDAFATGGYPWAWVQSQKELVRSALSGMSLCFAMAFLVMNIATLNILMSLLCVLTVAGIIATAFGIGIVAIMGWPLGISESISTVILIGFSMDYVLHLSDAYTEAKGTRMERTQTALLHLGVSVVAGANTTNLAGVWLWLGTMLFFQKFAFLINVTISAALVWSLVFFPCLCMIVGPEGDFGSWKRLLAMCGIHLSDEDEDTITGTVAAPAAAKTAGGFLDNDDAGVSERIGAGEAPVPVAEKARTDISYVELFPTDAYDHEAAEIVDGAEEGCPSRRLDIVVDSAAENADLSSIATRTSDSSATEGQLRLNQVVPLAKLASNQANGQSAIDPAAYHSVLPFVSGE